MRTIIILLLSIFSISAIGQTKELTKLNGFSNLIGGTWLTETEWSNGNQFKQEIIFEWGLNHKIVKVKTLGTVDQRTKEYGLRNEGIRAWNAQDSTIQFWEFDVFGGITSGLCYFDGKDLHYEYEYHSQKLRESWLFIDSDTYEYKVSSLLNGKIDKVYMESVYKRTEK